MLYLCTSLFCQTWNCFSGLPKLRQQITKITYLACVHSTSAAQWNSLKLWFHNILWAIILKSCSAYALSTKFISYHGDQETLATLHKTCCSAYAFWGKGTTYQNLQPHRQDYKTSDSGTTLASECTSQIGNLPQIGANIKHIWNHHPDNNNPSLVIKTARVPVSTTSTSKRAWTRKVQSSAEESPEA